MCKNSPNCNTQLSNGAIKPFNPSILNPPQQNRKSKKTAMEVMLTKVHTETSICKGFQNAAASVDVGKWKQVFLCFLDFRSPSLAKLWHDCKFSRRCVYANSPYFSSTLLCFNSLQRSLAGEGWALRGHTFRNVYLRFTRVHQFMTNCFVGKCRCLTLFSYSWSI